MLKNKICLLKCCSEKESYFFPQNFLFKQNIFEKFTSICTVREFKYIHARVWVCVELLRDLQYSEHGTESHLLWLAEWGCTRNRLLKDRTGFFFFLSTCSTLGWVEIEPRLVTNSNKHTIITFIRTILSQAIGPDYLASPLPIDITFFTINSLTFYITCSLNKTSKI